MCTYLTVVMCVSIYFCSVHLCTVPGKPLGSRGGGGIRGVWGGWTGKEREKERRGECLLLCVRDSRRIFEHQKKCGSLLKIWEEDLGGKKENAATVAKKKKKNISLWR